MLNKVILIGHLGRDPEVRRTQSGDRVVSFGLATSERWKDKASGERRERTQWHNVVIFNDGLGHLAEDKLRKGSKVYLEGQIQSRKYKADDGGDRTVTEIVLKRYGGALTLLDAAERGPAPDEDSYGATRSRDQSYAQARDGAAIRGASADRGDLSDDVPF